MSRETYTVILENSTTNTQIECKDIKADTNTQGEINIGKIITQIKQKHPNLNNSKIQYQNKQKSFQCSLDDLEIQSPFVSTDILSIEENDSSLSHTRTIKLIYELDQGNNNDQQNQNTTTQQQQLNTEKDQKLNIDPTTEMPKNSSTKQEDQKDSKNNNISSDKPYQEEQAIVNEDNNQENQQTLSLIQEDEKQSQQELLKKQNKSSNSSETFSSTAQPQSDNNDSKLKLKRSQSISESNINNNKIMYPKTLDESNNTILPLNKQQQQLQPSMVFEQIQIQPSYDQNMTQQYYKTFNNDYQQLQKYSSYQQNSDFQNDSNSQDKKTKPTRKSYTYENQPETQRPRERRVKERSIMYVLKKVIKWRTIYDKSVKGQDTKDMSRPDYKTANLQEAADYVQLSRKTLDDYYSMIRRGQKYGFDFVQKVHEKMGVLRQFIKEKENNDGKQKTKSVDIFEIWEKIKQEYPEVTLKISSDDEDEEAKIPVKKIKTNQQSEAPVSKKVNKPELISPYPLNQYIGFQQPQIPIFLSQQQQLLFQQFDQQNQMFDQQNLQQLPIQQIQYQNQQPLQYQQQQLQNQIPQQQLQFQQNLNNTNLNNSSNNNNKNTESNQQQQQNDAQKLQKKQSQQKGFQCVKSKGKNPEKIQQSLNMIKQQPSENNTNDTDSSEKINQENTQQQQQPVIKSNITKELKVIKQQGDSVVLSCQQSNTDKIIDSTYNNNKQLEVEQQSNNNQIIIEQENTIEQQQQPKLTKSVSAQYPKQQQQLQQQQQQIFPNSLTNIPPMANDVYQQFPPIYNFFPSSLQQQQQYMKQNNFQFQQQNQNQPQQQQLQDQNKFRDILPLPSQNQIMNPMYEYMLQVQNKQQQSLQQIPDEQTLTDSGDSNSDKSIHVQKEMKRSYSFNQIADNKEVLETFSGNKFTKIKTIKKKEINNPNNKGFRRCKKTNKQQQQNQSIEIKNEEH